MRLACDSTPSIAPRPLKTPAEKARAAKRLKRLMAADPFKSRNPRVLGGITCSRFDRFQAKRDLGSAGLIPTAGPTVANRAATRGTSVVRDTSDCCIYLKKVPNDTFSPGIAPGAGDSVEWVTGDSPLTGRHLTHGCTCPRCTP